MGDVLLDTFGCDSSSRNASAGDGWLSSARLVSRTKLPQLLEEHRPYLKRVAEKEVPTYLLPRFDASDVVQETLLKAFRQFDQFAGETDSEFVSWIRSILLNQIIDTIRHHGRQVRDLHRDCKLPEGIECEKSLSASDLCLQREQQERIHDALEKLPEDYRRVIRLRQEEDMSFADIGTAMDRSPDAVRMLWGRAIVLLGKIMQADSPQI